MSVLSGRVVVITGAAGTIGTATARMLLEAGATVVGMDRDVSSPALKGTSERPKVRGTSPKLHTLACDITDETAVARMKTRIRELSSDGHIDALINSAGVEGKLAFVTNADPANWRHVFDVNVVGSLLMTKHVAPLIRRGGALVNVGSTAAFAGAPGVGAYVASKHALLGLTRTTALEVQEQGIRVHCLCPPAVSSPMMDSIDQQRGAVLGVATDALDAARYISPTEVASNIVGLVTSSDHEDLVVRISGTTR